MSIFLAVGGIPAVLGDNTGRGGADAQEALRQQRRAMRGRGCIGMQRRGAAAASSWEHGQSLLNRAMRSTRPAQPSSAAVQLRPGAQLPAAWPRAGLHTTMLGWRRAAMSPASLVRFSSTGLLSVSACAQRDTHRKGGPERRARWQGLLFLALAHYPPSMQSAGLLSAKLLRRLPEPPTCSRWRQEPTCMLPSDSAF